MVVRGLLVTLSLLVVTIEAHAVPVMPPSKEQINQWINQLGDRSFPVRERAQQNLWQAGAPAEEPLRKVVAESGDKEVVRRASEVLDKFKWGLYPDTPKKIAELITQYQGSEAGARLKLVAPLLEQGPAGVRALLKIATAEENGDTRRRLYDTVSSEMSRALPRMIAENEYATLEALLELSMQNNRESGLRHFVAFQSLRGKLPDRIAHYEAILARQPADKDTAELLCYLHRANNDAVAARKVAEKAGLNSWLVGLLIERGEWTEAARLFKGDEMPPVQRLGMRALLFRRAGKSTEFEAAIKDLVDHARKNEADSSERWYAAKGLFVNGRADEALALLEARSSTRAEILWSRLKFKEALDATGYNHPQSGPQNVPLELLAARILHAQGEKEQAQQIVARFAKEVDAKKGAPSWVDTLLYTQVQLGQRAEADKLFLLLISEHEQMVIPGHWWRTLFGEDTALAPVWWKILRTQKPGEEGAATLKKLRSLLAGQIKGKDLDALFEAAGEIPRNEAHCRALAQIADRSGDVTRAAKFYRQWLDIGTSTDATLPLGDWLAGRKQWREAADAYALAWERDRKQPLPLFLQGWALQQAGQAKDGDRLMEQAHWLPLGDDSRRMHFAEELERRGHPKQATRELTLIVRTCSIDAFYSGEARRQLALTALEQKDYLAAAEGQEHALIRLLSGNVSFLDDTAYVGVPHYIHRHRAHGLILAGKFDEANKEIDLCLGLLPTAIELPLELVPALESKGQKKAADALFERVFKLKTQLARENPKSATVHNSLAWLCAVTRRELDTALVHARKAVELEPDRAAYRDTLAEILFQKGEQEKAIAEIKKCMELEPKRTFYPKQLKRMQAGDRKAALPPEND